jgi:hypothetical protein
VRFCVLAVLGFTKVPCIRMATAFAITASLGSTTCCVCEIHAPRDREAQRQLAQARRAHRPLTSRIKPVVEFSSSHRERAEAIRGPRLQTSLATWPDLHPARPVRVRPCRWIWRATNGCCRAQCVLADCSAINQRNLGVHKSIAPLADSLTEYKTIGSVLQSAIGSPARPAPIRMGKLKHTVSSNVGGCPYLSSASRFQESRLLMDSLSKA